MGNCGGSANTPPFLVNVVAKDAICTAHGGSIRCIPEQSGSYTYKWTRDGEPMALGADADEATGLVPATYQVEVRNAFGNISRLSIDIESARLPTVTGYTAKNATSDMARNGSVSVVTENMPKCNYLWTSGVTTSEPTLLDVPPGLYCATPIVDGEPIVFVSACNTARVSV